MLLRDFRLENSCAIWALFLFGDKVDWTQFGAFSTSLASLFSDLHKHVRGGSKVSDGSNLWFQVHEDFDEKNVLRFFRERLLRGAVYWNKKGTLNLFCPDVKGRKSLLDAAAKELKDASEGAAASVAPSKDAAVEAKPPAAAAPKPPAKPDASALTAALSALAGLKGTEGIRAALQKDLDALQPPKKPVEEKKKKRAEAEEDQEEGESDAADKEADSDEESGEMDVSEDSALDCPFQTVIYTDHANLPTVSTLAALRSVDIVVLPGLLVRSGAEELGQIFSHFCGHSNFLALVVYEVKSDQTQPEQFLLSLSTEVSLMLKTICAVDTDVHPELKDREVGFLALVDFKSPPFTLGSVRYYLNFIAINTTSKHDNVGHFAKLLPDPAALAYNVGVLCFFISDSSSQQHG